MQIKSCLRHFTGIKANLVGWVCYHVRDEINVRWHFASNDNQDFYKCESSASIVHSSKLNKKQGIVNTLKKERMVTSHIIGSFLVISLSLASLVSTRYIADDFDIERIKRQTADMRASELLAIQEMLRRLRSQSCKEFACGLVDIGRRYQKRSWSDQRIAELKAKLGLLYPDVDIAHGRFDPFRIGRRKRDAPSPFKPSQIKEILRKRSNLKKETWQ